MSSNNTSNNVVSLFDKKKKIDQGAASASSMQSTEPSLSELMKKNRENDERLRKERLKANESVLKTYRIKS